MPHRRTLRSQAATRLPDRLFVGGCVATYLVLMASVAAALQLYQS